MTVDRALIAHPAPTERPEEFRDRLQRLMPEFKILLPGDSVAGSRLRLVINTVDPERYAKRAAEDYADLTAKNVRAWLGVVGACLYANGTWVELT